MFYVFFFSHSLSASAPLLSPEQEHEAHKKSPQLPQLTAEPPTDPESNPVQPKPRQEQHAVRKRRPALPKLKNHTGQIVASFFKPVPPPGPKPNEKETINY